jgi:hypothetical protein
MAPARFSASLCVALLFAGAIPALAQLSPSEPDPLARIREAAKMNVEACSATGETLCEQVAPKIIANAQGDSPLAENLRRFSKDQKGHKTQASKETAALVWAAEAFLDSGVEAHIEKYPSPAGGPAEQENLVAEFRGREKPDEWVLLGAHLGPRERGPGAVDSSCDAAAVIEAARDISLTGVHPRRSIRFVLFTGKGSDMTGSWAYVRSHRSELDQDRAAIVLLSDCSRVTGYLLHGRPEIESGVREAIRAGQSFGDVQFAFRPIPKSDGFDFFLEGVPSLTAFPLPTTITLDGPAPVRARGSNADLKRNAAIVAVTAFGLAERAAPLGPRQTRAEIEYLLKIWGPEVQLKTAGIWPLWESGERGRMP